MCIVYEVLLTENYMKPVAFEIRKIIYFMYETTHAFTKLPKKKKKNPEILWYKATHIEVVSNISEIVAPFCAVVCIL